MIEFSEMNIRQIYTGRSLHLLTLILLNTVDEQCPKTLPDWIFMVSLKTVL